MPSFGPPTPNTMVSDGEKKVFFSFAMHNALFAHAYIRNWYTIMLWLSSNCWYPNKMADIMIFNIITSLNFGGKFYQKNCSARLDLGESSKKRIFYGQGDHSWGEGVSPIDPDRKQMWKLWPIFFHWNLIPWYSKRILSHCDGSQNWVFMPFLWLQMIIRRDWPLANYNVEGWPPANNYPEGPASCK